MSYLPPLPDGRDPSRFQQRYPAIPHFYHYAHPQSTYFPIYHQQIPRPLYDDPYSSPYPKYELGAGPAAFPPAPLSEAPLNPLGGAVAASEPGAERKKEKERDRERGRGDYDVQVPLHRRISNLYDRVVAWFYRSMMLRRKRLLNYLRVACVITPIVTTLFCYAVGMFLGHSFSKYPVPFLSYTGAETPEKFFFVVGNSAASLMFIPVLLVNQAGIIYVRGGTNVMCVLANFGLLTGLAAAAFLSLLSIFDTLHFKAIHYSFAISFFVCSFLWALSEATAHFLWFRNEPKNYFLKKAIVLKYSVLVVLFAVLLIYIITTADKSCNYQMNLDEYEHCPASQTIAAVTQYALLGLILLYIGTLSFKKFEESVLARDYDPYKAKTTSSFTELLSDFKDSRQSSKLSSSAVTQGGGGGGATESGQYSEIELTTRKMSGKSAAEMSIDLPLPSSPPPPPPQAPSAPPAPAATSSLRGIAFPTQPFIETIHEEPLLRSSPSTSSQRFRPPLSTNKSARSLLSNPTTDDSSDESYLSSLKSSNGRRKFSLTSEHSRSSIDLHSDPNRPQPHPLHHFKSVVDLRHSEPSAPPVQREDLYEMQERMNGKRRSLVEGRRVPGANYEAPYNPHLGAPLDPSVFQSRPF